MSNRSLYFAADFETCAGTVSICPKSRRILLFRNNATGECMLPKGRVDVDEILKHTALRETFEETGYKPKLLKHRDNTRAPTPNLARNERFWQQAPEATIPPPSPRQDKKQTEAENRYRRHNEPFALQQRDSRQLSGRTIHKSIYWYLAEVNSSDEQAQDTHAAGEENFETVWCPWDDIDILLTFEDDIRIARRAKELAEVAFEERKADEKRATVRRGRDSSKPSKKDRIKDREKPGKMIVGGKRLADGGGTPESEGSKKQKVSQ